MISDEEIQAWADDLTDEEPLKHALLELLAHRKAWSEPAAYEVNELLCHTLEEAEIYVGKPAPLYRKPFTE